MRGKNKRRRHPRRVRKLRRVKYQERGRGQKSRANAMCQLHAAHLYSFFL